MESDVITMNGKGDKVEVRNEDWWEKKGGGVGGWGGSVEKGVAQNVNPDRDKSGIGWSSKDE